MSQFVRRIQQGVAPSGAALVVTPASGSYNSGSTVTLTIRCQSGSVPVNAVQANLSYPTARLTFQSISTSSSAFDTTIESTGGSGSVNLGVGSLSGPVSGDVVVGTVTFTAGSAGSAAVSFADGSGIADAATSTDICKRKIGATYTIT